METRIRKINSDSVLKRCRERGNPVTGYKGEWARFITDTGTFEGGFFTTLTFGYPPSQVKMNCYLNLLLHFLNQKLYGRKYKQRNHYLQGFAFFELQYSGSPHIHFLFFNDHSFYAEGKKSFETHFFEEAQKIKNLNGKGEPRAKIFFNEGLDVQQIYSSPHLISYLLKTMKGDDDRFIGVLCKDGVTWA